MVRKALMKRLALPGLLLLTLCACAQQSSTDNVSGNAAAEQTPTPAELSPEEGTFAFVDGNGEEVGPSATPTPKPSATPTPEPESVQTLAFDLNELRSLSYSEEELARIAEFYSNALFTGDSVLLGFNNYCARSEDPVCAGLKFLSAGSYSLHNAFREVSESSIHPLYQGQQYPLWESVPMIAPERIFLFFGINDVSWGVQESLDMYPLLIERIVDACPGLDVTILSATYTAEGAGKGGINNENIAAFNEGAAQMAAEHGWGYVDIADVLSDGAGNLAAEYCSDGFVHETYAAYDVWYLMLKEYAAQRLGFGKLAPSQLYVEDASEAEADATEIQQEYIEDKEETEGTVDENEEN